MLKKEAIDLAISLIKADSLAHLVDLAAPRARYVRAEEEMKETRANYPHLTPKHRSPDYWEITYPYLKEDPFDRMGLTIIVYPHSRNAKVLEI